MGLEEGQLLFEPVVDLPANGKRQPCYFTSSGHKRSFLAGFAWVYLDLLGFTWIGTGCWTGRSAFAEASSFAGQDGGQDGGHGGGLVGG
jgi:hypothetical protein